MLSAPGNSPADIAWQTILERGAAIVRYVAQAGMKFERENPFWPELLALLPRAPDPKAGACGSVLSVINHPELNHQIQVQQGVLSDPCGELLRTFFRERR